MSTPAAPSEDGGRGSGDLPASAAVSHTADKCAHGPLKTTACGRCAAVCPEDAIRTANGTVSVDAAACTACGACAAVCPTGAMVVPAAAAEDILAVVHGRIADARLASGRAPAVMFHQQDDERAAPDATGDAPPPAPSIEIAVPLARIGWVGPEVWLGALSYGARQVLVRLPEGYPLRLQRAIDGQRRWAAALLDAVGIGGRRIQVLQAAHTSLPIPAPRRAAAASARFSPFRSKRDLIRRSAIHLARCAGFSGSVVALPQGAPFGSLDVDAEACTLCMACCGGCPTGALSPAGGLPALTLNEAACIQCGACERICPEKALRCRPRMSLNADAGDRLTLHEQPPLACLRCGKGFAAPAMVARIAAQLKGHWMYRDERSLGLLNLCGACRVRELVAQRPQEEIR